MTVPNAERVGAYLSSFENASGRSLAARGRPVGVYANLLEEWGVPGISAPADVDTAAAERWSRSVTLAVLRCLRRQGHLRPPTAGPRHHTEPDR